MKYVLAFAVFIIATVPSAEGQTKLRRAASNLRAEAEIRRIEREREDAYERGDLGALKRIWAEDLILINPSGVIRNRRQLLDEFGSGKTKFQAVSTDDVQVRIYGDVAVITGRTTLKGRDPGGDVDAQNRFTRVYVRRRGRWQMVSAQATRIAQQ